MMARLFSALVPPEAVVADLAARVAEVDSVVSTLRWTPAQRWHVTLGFFGDSDDPRRRTAWLRRRAQGLTAPRLRLAGGGTFPGALWVGVVAATDDDVRVLARLAKAAGAGRQGYRPHLTVARWRAGQPDKGILRDLFADYLGPWFTPMDVVLMHSLRAASGLVYTPLDRVPLRAV